MKNTSKCLVAGALALSTPMVAQAESPHTFSANVGLFTDYMFRGISQTSGNPAVQGGFDYSYDTGSFADLYAGIWASNIAFDGSVEADYYGGATGEFGNGISWDVGGLFYDYPGGAGSSEYFEAYGSLGYTFPGMYEPTVGVDYAYSPDFFGNTGDAHWVSPSLGLSLPHGFGLSASYGFQDVDDGGNYSTYSVGLSKELGMFSVSLDWIDTFDEEEFCAGFQDDCDGRLVLGVSSSF